jgi:hypothetical protein
MFFFSSRKAVLSRNSIDQPTSDQTTTKAYQNLHEWVDCPLGYIDFPEWQKLT